MSEPEIRQMPITCDFCAHAGMPLWRYEVPPKTILVATYDRKTGMVDKTMADGALGACVLCDEILQSKLSHTIPSRVAARMMLLPQFQAMTREQRQRSKNGWAKQLKRIVPLLSNRRPHVHGEDPMDGLGLFSTKRFREDGPRV